MRIISIILLLLMLALQGCGGNDKREDGPSAEELYDQASRALNAQNYPAAIRLYRDLTIRYPFGRHAEQAMLDMAFAQYKGGANDAAIESLNRFLRTYPTHPNVDYAWYLKGLVNYDETMNFLRKMLPGRASDRDQQGEYGSVRTQRGLRQAPVTTEASPRGPGIIGEWVQGVGFGTGRRVLYLSLNLGFLKKKSFEIKFVVYLNQR